MLGPPIVRYGDLPGKTLGPRAVPLPRDLLSTSIGIFVAGGVGALLRMALTAWTDGLLAARLPFAGTLTVNLAGCFFIGVAAHVLGDGPARPIVLGGLLGGFTTYSAFALFTVDAAQHGRIGWAAFQLAAHFLGGALAVLLGMLVGRAILSAGSA